MDIGDSKGPRVNSVSHVEHIAHLQQLVNTLIRRSSDHVAGIKTALRLVMILLKDHVPPGEFVLITNDELLKIEDEFALGLDEMTMDNDGCEVLISLSLKAQTKKSQPPFEFINAVDTPLAAAYTHSGIIN